MTTRRKSLGRTRAREIPALLFALVWLLGYEAVPLAHVALHAQLAPHSHGVAGDAAAHCHGDVCHEDAPTAEHADAGDAGDPLAHGQNSLEHRGVAALGTDLTVFVGELTLVAEIAELTAPEARVDVFAPQLPPSRGPPA